MAIYEHLCTNTECNYEWEETYSIKADPPKICPKCNQETAKRMISMGGKGQVILTGQDLVAKIKTDTEALKKEIYSNSNSYANFLGDDKYQQIQTAMDKNKGKY